MALMNVVEEIVGGWAFAHIPQVGVYKLLAKRAECVQWAHFQTLGIIIVLHLWSRRPSLRRSRLCRQSGAASHRRYRAALC
jgi:hypothetical protein